MDSDPLVELLRDAEMRFRSVAFLDEHTSNHIGGDLEVQAALRRKDMGAAVRFLETVLECDMPVELRLAGEPLKVYDTSAWEPVPDDEVAEIYVDEQRARAAFYRDPMTLHPGMTFIVEGVVEMMVPGDPAPEVFVQNLQTGLTLSVEDLAVALHKGARLRFPNQV